MRNVSRAFLTGIVPGMNRGQRPTDFLIRVKEPKSLVSTGLTDTSARASFIVTDYSRGMSEDVIPYRSCLTCGRLMPLQAGSKQVYCSPECSRENLRCPICGRYFEKETGVARSSGDEVCSPDCARVNHSYDPLFKELS